MPTVTAAPGTVANDNSFGTAAWTNPSNAGASDNSYATASPVSSPTQYLKATNFGFALPPGVTINGITVTVERKADDTINDSRVRLVKGGTVQATDKASGAAWPAADGSVSYGGVSDLWSGTFLTTDVNASDFGCVLSCVGGAAALAYVDHITISVTYTPPSKLPRLLRP